MFEIVSKIENISEIVLLDDYNVPKLQHLYTNFDEIVYFPSVKKVRLIEAINIEKLSSFKFNSKEIS